MRSRYVYAYRELCVGSARERPSTLLLSGTKSGEEGRAFMRAHFVLSSWPRTGKQRYRRNEILGCETGVG